MDSFGARWQSWGYLSGAHGAASLMLSVMTDAPLQPPASEDQARLASVRMLMQLRRHLDQDGVRDAWAVDEMALDARRPLGTLGGEV